MLRRSLGVAGPSAAALLSTATMRGAASAAAARAPLCRSSSQASSSRFHPLLRSFSSTAPTSRGRYDSGFIPRPAKGEPTPGYRPRWSGDSNNKDRKGKGGKDSRFKGKFQGKSRNQVKDADFSVPEPPTGQEVGRKLVERLTAMARDPELPSQLVAYGIKDGPAQLLLQSCRSDAGDQRPLSKRGSAKGTRGDNAATAIELFRTWAEQAKDAIPDLAVLHDTGKPAQADAFSYLSDAVSSYSNEGEECLGRFCISAFLDWVDGGFAALHASSTSDAGSPTAAEAAEISLVRSQLSLLRSCMDLRFPVHQYPRARSLTRNIHLHVGPTNSGKTHGALVALSKARTGIFAGPLRLLAHEVWDRFNSGTVSPGVAARACNLVTGEEKRTVDTLAGLVSCTVEMVSTQHAVDVGVVDEIQMIGDAQRGYAWTNAVLGLPAKELHLCGEASVIPLIEHMAAACGDHLTVHRYERLTPLSVADESLHDDLTQIEKGDCIVAFSRSGIFALKRDIEQRTGLRCAVAYGALPPETKAEQAKLFNAGKLDVMVASDAIGMGLNLRIKRVVFDTLSKWNGKEEVVLSASQIKQIAGRAGRYGTQDKSTKTADLGGVVTTRHEHELDILRAALASPLVPITRAAIQPSSDALSQLSAMLPGKDGKSSGLRTLSQLFGDVSLLSRIDSDHFFLSDFSQQLRISPLIESASSGMLTVGERETFSNAPANTRDERVVAFLCNGVRQFSRGALVEFDDAAKDLAMLEVEEAVLALMQKAIDARDAASARARDDEQLPLFAYLNTGADSVQVGGSAAHPLINITTLLMLESLHRCFTLYLWLSFRFPLAFCYRAEVGARKKVAEEAIDFVLQGIRFGRAKRLQALGRTPGKAGRGAGEWR
ncbi:related to SUV3-ATP-dependent RNA helicase, mitochondrial [Sporisorium reilianum f. sp. reilianum]|uniref:ATP-dependent RNA helicase SUV3, mitochondrial n=1 Tax=Sporisorium reilianum f. sp. reilianum TaxID=72559 RepID=A0A2N8UKQ0_9BASI|nr:related to SUV3-ATP-dependent RNA helicase, mitochondrial [Sporisorium reilianum f. sp. reilianum]